MSGMSGSWVTFTDSGLERAEGTLKGLEERMEMWSYSLGKNNREAVEQWNGSSGDGFMRAGVTLEEDYKKVMAALQKEIERIGTYRTDQFQLDSNAAKKFTSLGEIPPSGKGGR